MREYNSFDGFEEFMFVLVKIFLYLIVFLIGATIGRIMKFASLRVPHIKEFAKKCKDPLSKSRFGIEFLCGACSIVLFSHCDPLSDMDGNIGKISMLYHLLKLVLYFGVFLVLMAISIIDFNTMKIQNELLVVILLIDSRNFCLYW
jgi:prepilin signal peptidase PulO-like enzyme (type II secretory pathway)